MPTTVSQLGPTVMSDKHNKLECPASYIYYFTSFNEFITVPVPYENRKSAMFRFLSRGIQYR